MNILENHIIKIESENPLTREEWKDDDYEDYVKVDIITNYYGIMVRETKVFQKDEWEEIKKFGYYLS